MPASGAQRYDVAMIVTDMQILSFALAAILTISYLIAKTVSAQTFARQTEVELQQVLALSSRLGEIRSLESPSEEEVFEADSAADQIREMTTARGFPDLTFNHLNNLQFTIYALWARPAARAVWWELATLGLAAVLTVVGSVLALI